jgi:hypothetical protein
MLQSRKEKKQTKDDDGPTLGEMLPSSGSQLHLSSNEAVINNFLRLSLTSLPRRCFSSDIFASSGIQQIAPTP